MTEPKRSNSRCNLDIAIDGLCICTGQEPTRVKRLIAIVIVGQMFPNGAAKGRNALKVRFGKDVTRFSHGLDTVRTSSLEEYVSHLEDSLTGGWSGFTGIIVPREPALPRGVPAVCVMRLFDVKLAYNGKSWMTSPLEVGHNKIGDVENPDMVSPPEVATILKKLGSPEPTLVPCMRLEHQIAQELHAFSGVGSECTRDPIDLQIAVTGGNLGYLEVRKVCVRLFEYHQEQGWSPTLVKEKGWEFLYGVQVQGLSVLSSVGDVVDWANSLVVKIGASAQPPIVLDVQHLSPNRTQLLGEAIEGVVAPSRTQESFCRKLASHYDLVSYV